MSVAVSSLGIPLFGGLRLIEGSLVSKREILDSSPVKKAAKVGDSGVGLDEHASVAIGEPSAVSRKLNTEKAAVDLALVSRAKAGESLAFQELVEKYEKRFFSIAFGILSNYEDAREATQEAFLKAYRSLNSFKGDASFYTWMYRIVHNVSIDISRRRYRKSEFGVEDMEHIEAAYHNLDNVNKPLSQCPDAEFRRKQLRSYIEIVMKKLSPVHRAVITLREVEGLSYDEMSETMKCSKGTIMSRLFHARKNFKQLLEELEEMGSLSEQNR